MKYPNIEAERARRGLSREKMAADLGVTRGTIYNWLSRGNIPQRKVATLVNYFKCPADYLLLQPATEEGGEQQ